MTRGELKGKGFDFYCPANVEEFKKALFETGLEYEFVEVTETTGPTTLVFLGVKRLTPTLKAQLKLGEVHL